MEKGGRTVIQMMKIQLRLKEKRLRNLLFFGLGFFFPGINHMYGYDRKNKRRCCESRKSSGSSCDELLVPV